MDMDTASSFKLQIKQKNDTSVLKFQKPASPLVRPLLPRPPLSRTLY